MKAARLWPLAIAGVLAVTVIANIALLMAAGDPSSQGMDTDYYAHALAWDSTMAEARHDAALGWRIDAAFGTPQAAGTPLTVRLTDAARAPLAGAAIAVEAIHNLDAAHPLHARLADRGAGRYEALLPLAHRGLWELRFDVRRGGERFSADLRRETDAR